jgi:Zn-dependent M28 family amino/carboxypeptidase
MVFRMNNKATVFVYKFDRYVIIGCSHDSWARAGAADPGIGLAMTTEMLRAFSSALTSGWRPRRSIMFISWDANLHASSGVSHWLQVG